MKSSILLFASLLITVNSIAQNTKGLIGSENWFKNWTNFKPATTEYKDASLILSGNITENTTLTKKTTYRITGNVYVTNNAILTIEAGTVLRGDSQTKGALIITKGSKIIAEGTETDPIIFTSNKNATERKSGDWGGLVILGDAPINKYGGVAVLDLNLDQKLSVYGGLDEVNDSGILKYVRIEFAGKKIGPGKEFNGLSLAGVGSNTKIEFVQVSFSNDDSFECYGGNVNLKNLLSYKATDDDFDFTQGTQAIFTNSIAMRYPYVSDVSKSRAIEIESYDRPENMDFTKKMTSITANNIVLANNEENLEGLVREAIYVADKSTLTFDNSIITGFNAAILIAENALNKLKDIDNISIKDSQINECVNVVLCDYNSNNIATDYSNSPYFINNQITKIQNIELFNDINIKKNPDFRLRSTTNFAFSK